MPYQSTPEQISRNARMAGAMYLAIIALGITSEFALRGPLTALGDGQATAQAIMADPLALRLSLLADTGMLLADIGLALLLFAVFSHVSRAVAGAAMIFRLMQAGVIAASLLALIGLLTLADQGALDGPTALALLDVHGTGYDLGLIFFGVNTVLTAWLAARSGLVPGWLPPLLYAAAAVYLVGSTVRLAAPELTPLIEPAYIIALIAEVSFMVILLRGFGRRLQPA